ncbi:HNH endonuclease [Bacillus sp. 7884-1]|uniref:HNH endonuclease n=1 Tax=Bacillus sp. 7884-1 TaxID=2021693 RepID=UPI000BA70277|nr:HNH endonuclease signature motif containing protein [Bacillus sp. 7884-1]PAE37554.1 HNH endonuclease [Bacillus sp. 7884-1]
MPERRGISDLNSLEILGGFKRSEIDNKITFYQLENNEKVVIKYSKLYENGTSYWFGVTPNAITLYQSKEISHIILILGYEGILKIPIEILYKYLKNANVTYNKENGLIKRHHITINFDSKIVLHNSVDKFILDDYYLYDEDIVCNDLNQKSKKAIFKEAMEFTDYSQQYIESEQKTKKRKESKAQKERIAILEDHTCQVCGFKEGYLNFNNKKLWIIEVDHILEKSKGGGESFDNLWVLCPNCHAKKTRGIIKIDPTKREVKERGVHLIIRDNHLGW